MGLRLAGGDPAETYGMPTRYVREFVALYLNLGKCRASEGTLTERSRSSNMKVREGPVEYRNGEQRRL